jgi:hypothetical protein
VDISPPPIGHNQPTLTSASEANVETGVLLLCKEFLVTAIQDRRLNRTHLRVLACFVEFVNRRTAKAWPGRQLIADTLGLDVRNVSNALFELRNWGYLIAERERVVEAGNRSLMVYTFGNVDHDTIRREIDAYVANIKGAKFTAPGEAKVTPEGEVTAKSPHRVNSKSPQGVNNTLVGELPENPTSPYAVDSNLDTKPTTVELNNSSPPEPELQPKPPAEKRATRLREEWILPKPWGVWAMEHFHISRDQVLGEAARFRDYWVSAPGAKAAKKDWEATWRNWIRGSQERPKYRARKVDAAISPGLTENHDSGSELDVLLEKARQQGR